jgi:hypothetical protein
MRFNPASRYRFADFSNKSVNTYNGANFGKLVALINFITIIGGQHPKQ